MPPVVVKALVVPLVASIMLLVSIPLLFGGGDPEPNAGRCSAGLAGADADPVMIAATIRERESRGDYQARAEGSTASGAYQFTDATWARYRGYPTAALAPPAVQDAKATEHIAGILAANNGDLAAVPVIWYIGYLPPPDDPTWDTIPNPEAGNRLTPRQYQTEWLTTHGRTTDDGHTPPGTPTSISGAQNVGRCAAPIGDTPGDGLQLATVEGITVHADIADQVGGLVQAAAGDGVTLGGGGYRDPAQQIQLRREHCGSSDYAVYDMPSSQCSPPTARPGSSNHERGLAIDFTCNGGSVSRSGSCFSWLSAHAADFGLHNLPSEPWHWSVDGT